MSQKKKLNIILSLKDYANIQDSKHAQQIKNPPNIKIYQYELKSD